MTSAEVTNGLALPYVAVAVAGKGGAVAVLLMTFMAVTSTLSAQILAVSSILTFDVYRVYFNKAAGNKEVIRWGHMGVVIFGVMSAAFTALFHYIGVDMGWTLYMLGKEALFLWFSNPKSTLTHGTRCSDVPRRGADDLYDHLAQAE